MKRLIPITLALALGLSLLSGCGNAASENTVVPPEAHPQTYPEAHSRSHPQAHSGPHTHARSHAGAYPGAPGGRGPVGVLRERHQYA